MQVDTLFLRDPSSRWIYQLTVCDQVSKLTTAELATTPSVCNMRATFECILETISVVIPGVQTDTGFEFCGIFEELLQERGIAMQAIQPRSPKQNGCVEWCQRIWRKELYETSSVVATLDEYRHDAWCLVAHHNHVRPHAELGGITPIGYLRKHHGGSSVVT